MKNKEFEILPIVRKYVELKKRGINHLGLCPFHKEKTPSFVVSENKNIFKCFGCGRSGGPVHFLIEKEGISFDKALEILSKEFDNTSKYKEELEVQLYEILDEFESHIDSVNKLMNFDRIVLDYCISSVKSLDDRLKKNDEIKITNVRFLPTNTIMALENIKNNDSLRHQYESIFNQCLVLLVSYFSSISKEVFRKAIDYFSIHNTSFLGAIKEDIKLSFEEMSTYDYNLSGKIGQLIIEKKSISFQDMQSINRTLKKYLKIDFKSIDKKTNNIILAQASRHCIVHSSEIVDEKFLNQIRNAENRDVIKDVSLNKKISVSPQEVELISESMREYFKEVIDKILKKI